MESAWIQNMKESKPHCVCEEMSQTCAKAQQQSKCHLSLWVFLYGFWCPCVTRITTLISEWDIITGSYNLLCTGHKTSKGWFKINKGGGAGVKEENKGRKQEEKILNQQNTSIFVGAWDLLCNKMYWNKSRRQQPPFYPLKTLSLIPRDVGSTTPPDV